MPSLKICLFYEDFTKSIIWMLGICASRKHMSFWPYHVSPNFHVFFLGGGGGRWGDPDASLENIKRQGTPSRVSYSAATTKRNVNLSLWDRLEHCRTPYDAHICYIFCNCNFYIFIHAVNVMLKSFALTLRTKFWKGNV